MSFNDLIDVGIFMFDRRTAFKGMVTTIDDEVVVLNDIDIIFRDRRSQLWLSASVQSNGDLRFYGLDPKLKVDASIINRIFLKSDAIGILLRTAKDELAIRDVMDLLRSTVDERTQRSFLRLAIKIGETIPDYKAAMEQSMSRQPAPIYTDRRPSRYAYHPRRGYAYRPRRGNVTCSR